jgi:hypothetical protein
MSAPLASGMPEMNRRRSSYADLNSPMVPARLRTGFSLPWRRVLVRHDKFHEFPHHQDS